MDNTQNKTVEINSEAHYRQPDGTCSKARVARVSNQDVVDLIILGDDGKAQYERKTVVYRKEPVAYSWHWPEDDEGNDEKDKSISG